MNNTTPLRLSNKTARQLWLSSSLLANTPTGPLDVMALINRLGFVQIDTIRNVTRAHHHILWSRNQNYSEKMLWPLLQKDRAIFEHFTHDASLIPMDFLPMWQRQFRRMGDKVARHEWYRSGLARAQVTDIKTRIRNEGALSTHAFDSKIEGPREMWARPPHKKALDQMWYAGELATCYRENFTKFYNLAERVFPAHLRSVTLPDAEQIDQLCCAAIDRLGFGTIGEIQRFWGAMDASEAKSWVNRQSNLIAIEVENADRSVTMGFAPPDIQARLADLSAPSTRLRLLNPFDPAIRDRKRLERLFGFEYRNEMFVPKAKRRWGYYVYPLLEKNQFVGRIELKADRAEGWMSVTGFWPEKGVQWSRARFSKLEAELARFAKLANIRDIRWLCAQSAS